jgi:ACS family glucarate transporter-like MFS transporter
VLTGVPLGSALAPLLVSWLMVTFGWRQSFVVTATLAFGGALLWWWYGRDQPSDHPGITENEARLITSNRAVAADRQDSGPLSGLLRNRVIILLSVSYIAEGYVLFMFVFWFYLYLVDVRGFSVLGGGFFASLPWIVSLFLTPAGGALADRFAARVGQLRGCRRVVMGGWIACGLFIVLGATASNPYLAVAGLSLGVGFILFTEAAFWSSAIYVSGPQAGAACGLMNMAGLFGGVISTPLVPVLVEHFGWSFAMTAAAAVAISGALIWLLVDEDETVSRQALTARVP